MNIKDLRGSHRLAEALGYKTRKIAGLLLPGAPFAFGC